jgi:hypothetical protein
VPWSFFMHQPLSADVFPPGLKYHRSINNL